MFTSSSAIRQLLLDSFDRDPSLISSLDLLFIKKYISKRYLVLDPYVIYDHSENGDHI